MWVWVIALLLEHRRLHWVVATAVLILAVTPLLAALASMASVLRLL